MDKDLIREFDACKTRYLNELDMLTQLKKKLLSDNNLTNFERHLLSSAMDDVTPGKSLETCIELEFASQCKSTENILK